MRFSIRTNNVKFESVSAWLVTSLRFSIVVAVLHNDIKQKILTTRILSNNFIAILAFLFVGERRQIQGRPVRHQADLPLPKQLPLALQQLVALRFSVSNLQRIKCR